MVSLRQQDLKTSPSHQSVNNGPLRRSNSESEAFLIPHSFVAQRQGDLVARWQVRGLCLYKLQADAQCPPAVLGNDSISTSSLTFTTIRSPVCLCPLLTLRFSLSHLPVTCLCIAVTPACPGLSAQGSTGCLPPALLVWAFYWYSSLDLRSDLVQYC